MGISQINRSKISLNTSIHNPTKPNMKLKGYYYDKMKKRERVAKREFSESYRFGKKNASDIKYESPEKPLEKVTLKKTVSKYLALKKKQNESPMSRLSQTSQL